MNRSLIKSDAWSGRIDGYDTENLRWHQVVKHISDQDLTSFIDKWVFLGFAGDEGVRRNQGRTGAKEGPESIRKAAAGLPIPGPEFEIADLGNYSAGVNLETDQIELSDLLCKIHQSNNRSLLLGGGHEITYPHFLGLKKAFPDKRIGIVNVDAHYDLREIDPTYGPTSGTGFFQILSEYPETGYFILGVSESSNTQILKNRAESYGVKQLSLFDIQLMPVQDVLYQVRMFAQQYDIIYLTVCMDAFSAAFAPGVSAPAGLGIIPDARFFTIFREINRLNKIHAFDIAEVNPSFDIDSRTSKLAAQLLYYWLV